MRRIIMAEQFPKIFSLISCPMIGEFGPATKIRQKEPCDTCGQSYRKEVVFLDYQFDAWESEELIRAGDDAYAITRRLNDAFQDAGIKGMSIQAMKVSRGSVFSQIDPENDVVIPDFQQLLINGKADGPSGWWDRGEVCPTCRRIAWHRTERVTDARFAKYENKPGPPRLVSGATWQGEDIFFLTDPGPPVVTENFKRVAEEQKVEGLVLDPAQWVA
jgi:hypothetical protein